jgi:outer membrane protein
MRIGSTAFLASAIALAVAAPAHSQTLAEAIAEAYRTNPTIEGSRYDLDAADEGLPQAKSQLRPSAEIDVTGTSERSIEGRASRRSNPFSPESSNRDTNRAEFTVSQPLYPGGRATAARDSAIAAIRSSREQLRGAEGDLVLAVITAYVDVRRYEQSLRIWRASTDELTKITQEIQDRYDVGDLTLTDVSQARAQLAIAKQQIVTAEQALEAARTDYAVLVGREPGELAEVPALPNLPRRVEDAFALAERQNPELGRAVFTEEQSRADIAAARAQGSPTVTLRGSAALNGDAVPYRLRDQDQSYTGSLVLSIPLSAGGLVASRVREAQARNGSARVRIEATRREVDRAVANAWNQMVTADRVSSLQEEQLRFAETQLDGMVNEYRIGDRSTFDVLYAQQQLRDAQVSLLASDRDRYIAQATVLREAGMLEIRAIMSGVQLHDPAKNLRRVENRNSVPWEALLAGLDRAGKPSAKVRLRKQPPTTGRTPRIAPISSGARDTPRLSRSLPRASADPATGKP